MGTIDEIDREEDLSTERCHKVLNNGKQCKYHAVNGSRFCAHHGGTIGLKAKERRAIYKTKWAAQVLEHANHPEILNLTEEIGIIRLTLETLLNTCDSGLELIAQMPQIQRTVNQVQSLVSTCDKIQRANSTLLSETQLVEIALKLGEQIAACISDEDTITQVRAIIAEVVVGIHIDEEQS